MVIVLIASIICVFWYQPCNAIPDLGYTNFNCDTTAGNPKNVNEVRPADIKVVGAIGNSLTAAFGAAANSMAEVNVNYRGLSFVIGGDKTLEEHVTIPNILKKFNSKLFGQSYGIGLPNDWDHAQLNAAVGGARAINMPDQARDLVQRMIQHPDNVDMQNDWKLINIFIGANDACFYCKNGPENGVTSSPVFYKKYVEEAIKYLHDNVPRAIVSIVSMLNIQLLGEVDKTNYVCRALHQKECACDTPNSTADAAEISRDYQAALIQIQDEGRYQKHDFTVVVQPAFVGILQPPLIAGGIADTSFFAPDCFHFSQYGHAVAAKIVWNNLVQPVGYKVENYNLTDTGLALQCPDVACPYIRTTINSKNCAL